MAIVELEMPPKSTTSPCANEINVVLRLTARLGLALMALESLNDSTKYMTPGLIKPKLADDVRV